MSGRGGAAGGVLSSRTRCPEGRWRYGQKRRGHVGEKRKEAVCGVHEIGFILDVPL